jgi:hypothetical protein
MKKNYIKRTTANPFATYSVEFLQSTVITNKATGEQIKIPSAAFKIHTHMRNSYCLATENDNKYFESWASIAKATGLDKEYFKDKVVKGSSVKKANPVKKFLIDSGLVLEGDPYQRCCFKTVLDVEDIKDTWEFSNPSLKDFKESYALQKKQYAEHMAEQEALEYMEEQEAEKDIDDQLNGNLEAFKAASKPHKLSHKAEEFLRGSLRKGQPRGRTGKYDSLNKNHSAELAKEFEKLVIAADKRGDQNFSEIYSDFVEKLHKQTDTNLDTEQVDHSISENIPVEEPKQNRVAEILKIATDNNYPSIFTKSDHPVPRTEFHGKGFSKEDLQEADKVYIKPVPVTKCSLCGEPENEDGTCTDPDCENSVIPF